MNSHFGDANCTANALGRTPTASACGRRAWLGGAIGLLLLVTGCAGLRPPPGVAPRTVTMLTTGYCDCGRCCNWERRWYHLWRPTVASGPHAGAPKQVGLTASGTRAAPGTVAADTAYYPFGTVLYVPGYGYGRVEDRGGAIKGPTRLDLFFDSHDAALEWGRRRLPVKVWK